jgi:hypothetical protein
MGANNTIQHAAVRYVLDSLMPALEQNPARRFMYVEMAFFARWYSEQTEKTQELTKKLVENGQLEFMNGGWCMHDEAAPHFVGMLDQTAIGHAFLEKEFGYQPRVGCVRVSVRAV